ncbi:hypothetical protein TNIN_361941 [Trichonephila inaurata madagascariensis]|uniref:Uncharacterized protein n=1 Tax=Trichonephila inaurata madagascariensis TaxID=2747483 RepID=A0A8X7C1Y0_9ARAC|nr:hypothetical protein TNIN_361941 [Trichonephila inaurata madagascariensis]
MKANHGKKEAFNEQFYSESVTNDPKLFNYSQNRPVEIALARLRKDKSSLSRFLRLPRDNSCFENIVVSAFLASIKTLLQKEPCSCFHSEALQNQTFRSRKNSGGGGFFPLFY